MFGSFRITACEHGFITFWDNLPVVLSLMTKLRLKLSVISFNMFVYEMYDWQVCVEHVDCCNRVVK